MYIAWMKFIICSGIIFLAGSQLTRYADIIAEKTGITRAWIGIVVLAAITSIPELFNGIIAVTLVGLPDLAIGNIFGANLYNMLTLANLSLLYAVVSRKSLYERASRSNLISAYYAIVLMLIACLSIALNRFIRMPVPFWVGLDSLAIAAVYLFSQRAVYLLEKRAKAHGLDERKDDVEVISFASALTRFLVSTAFVVAAGIWLPYVGKEIAEVMGWANSFVGSAFLGFATTMPEFVVSTSAILVAKSPDMCIGNLFGSNVFDVFLLFVDDVFYGKGPFFAAVSFANLYFGLVVICAIAVGTLALILKPRRRLFGVIGWDWPLICSIYLFGIILLYKIGLKA